MKSDPKKLLKKHRDLIQSDMMKVTSHVQRKEKDSDWIINTIMIEGWDVPFRFRRRKMFKNVKGARVNMTYYRGVENIAGMEMEVMNVVRIKIS
ncbi:MAG: hypothetical protein PVG75_04180 [Thioalkalispiraceae bacterium]